MSIPVALYGHQGMLAANRVFSQSIGSIVYPYTTYQRFRDHFAMNRLSYNRALCVSLGLCNIFHYGSFLTNMMYLRQINIIPFCVSNYALSGTNVWKSGKP